MFERRNLLLWLMLLVISTLILLVFSSSGLMRLAGELTQKPTTAAPMPSQTDYPSHLRLGLNISQDSALHAAALRFAQVIHDRSQGRLRVTVIPDQQLGNDDEMVEMVRAGKLDLVLTPTAKLSTLVPAMQYVDLPFYFSGPDELYHMLDGEPGQLLLKKLNRVGMVGLTYWGNGFKQLTANRPIHSPDDYAGLRIRVMKSRLLQEQFGRLGAQPVLIDFHETRQALADGAVDGQENPLVAIVGMNFHQVQSHLVLSNHAYLGYVFSASQALFQRLPIEFSTLIQQVALELTPWEREETQRREAAFLQQVRQAGVEVITLSPAQKQAFIDRLQPLVRSFSEHVGYDLLAKTDELRYLRQQQTAAPDQVRPIVIGLDADLSLASAAAGMSIYRGVELALAEINQRGGLLGRPLKLLARDHYGRPESGIANIDFFVRQADLVAVVGGLHSAVIVEEMALLHHHQLPMLVPWAASTKLTQHSAHNDDGSTRCHIFRFSMTDGQIAPLLLQRALDRSGRVAILLESSNWGRSNLDAMQSLIDRHPDRVVTGWFGHGEDNFSSRLRQLVEQEGISTLVMVANANEGYQIVEAMAGLPRRVPIISHWGITGGDFWQRSRAALRYVDVTFVQSAILSSPASPALADFVDSYRRYYQLAPTDPIPAPIGALHSYELTRLLAAAITQAGSLDRRAISDALLRLPAVDGLLGRYDPPFLPDQQEALRSMVPIFSRYDSRGFIVRADE
jgi:C4-dicarboxylate-binding protein DctP